MGPSRWPRGHDAAPSLSLDDPTVAKSQDIGAINRPDRKHLRSALLRYLPSGASSTIHHEYERLRVVGRRDRQASKHDNPHDGKCYRFGLPDHPFCATAASGVRVRALLIRRSSPRQSRLNEPLPPLLCGRRGAIEGTRQASPGSLPGRCLKRRIGHLQCSRHGGCRCCR